MEPSSLGISVSEKSGRSVKAGSIPLDSLSSLGALAVVVALIASIAALAFLVLWVTPPGIALVFKLEDSHGRLSHWFQRSKDGQELPKSQQWRRVFLFSSVTGGAVWACIAAWTLPSLFGAEWLRWLTCAVSVIAAGILCWKFVTYPLPKTDELSPSARRLPALGHRLFFVVCYAATSLFPLLLFMILMMTSDFRHDGRGPVMWALLAVGFAVVTLVNGVGLAASQRLKGPHALAILALVGCYTLFVIVVPLGSSPRLLDGVMKLSTIRMVNVSLALDDKNCAAARTLGVLTSPGPATSSPSDNSCLLENVTVISRVGERWVIACDRDDPTTDQAQSPKRRNFRIEAKGVLGEVDASGEVRTRTGKVGVCG